MTTAAQIINTSLHRLGVLAEGEAPTGQQADDALDTLNDMIESWSLEGLMLLARTITTFQLTPTKADMRARVE